jgi:hypothetical protein
MSATDDLLQKLGANDPIPSGMIVLTWDDAQSIATLITSLREALETATDNLNSRDDFLVSNGDWEQFLDSLPDTRAAVKAALVDRAETAERDKRNVDDLLSAAVSDYNDVLAPLQAIAAIEPVPLSEADVAPELFGKLNRAIKLARTALDPSRKETI